MPDVRVPLLAAALFSTALLLHSADPTFLKRSISAVSPKPDDLTRDARRAEYRPLFGTGDAEARQLKGIARFGELTVGDGGTSALVSYPAEEQIYFILSGRGEVTCDDNRVSVRQGDFLYLPPGTVHGISGATSGLLRVLVMGFRIPGNATIPPARKLMIANVADVSMQTLPGHGPSTQFQLLIGTTESKRDKLAAASRMVSLFIMDFAPGGTNIPHHHETEEEIYFILRGAGDMVAGGGLDGNEGR